MYPAARAGEDRGTRFRFPLVYLALVLAAALLSALALWYPELTLSQKAPPRTANRPPRARWGHVEVYNGAMIVTLGPAGDRRHRHEFVFDHVEFTSAGVSISNDSGRTFHPIGGTPMVNCGYHWQGYALNAIVATRRCVPSWATSSSGRRGREWLRLENLAPYARVVLVRMPARTGRRLGALLTS